MSASRSALIALVLRGSSPWREPANTSSDEDVRSRKVEHQERDEERGREQLWMRRGVVGEEKDQEVGNEEEDEEEGKAEQEYSIETVWSKR